MNASQATARVWMLETGRGGLKFEMPSGTRSILLKFEPAGADGDENVVGAAISPVGGSALVPGAQDLTVELRFWSTQAREIVHPGSNFDLWYGRAVGRGRIDHVKLE